MLYRKYIIRFIMGLFALAVIKVSVLIFTPENPACYDLDSESADGCESALIP
jgi:hypothetical protein